MTLVLAGFGRSAVSESAEGVSPLDPSRSEIPKPVESRPVTKPATRPATRPGWAEPALIRPDARPAWAKPLFAKPAKPGETKSADTKSADTKSADTKSSDAKSSDAKSSDAKPAPLPPPIVFFVAKGEPNACGPGCQEWIVADGTIDAGADGRLRTLLNKLHGRKLPVYFHSPGGLVVAGLAIGRLLRTRGLTAGVGWTIPQGCDPKQARETACDKLKRSGRDLTAELDTQRTMCNSACVYALVGAAVRDVGAGIKLGVHSSSISFSLRRADSEGHVTQVPAKVAPEVLRAAMQAGYERIAVYLREMGIGAGLLAAAREVRNDQLHYLTRDELVAFGIDRRERIEGAWWLLDQPTGASAVKLIEVKESDAFRRTYLRLTCRNANAVRFQFARELGADRAGLAIPLRVTASGKKILMPRGVAVAQSNDKPPLEVRSADLPLSVLDEAGFVVETVDAAQPSPASPDPSAPDQHFGALATPASGPALGTLMRRCIQPPANQAPTNYDRIPGVRT